MYVNVKLLPEVWPLKKVIKLLSQPSIICIFHRHDSSRGEKWHSLTRAQALWFRGGLQVGGFRLVGWLVFVVGLFFLVHYLKKSGCQDNEQMTLPFTALIANQLHNWRKYFILFTNFFLMPNSQPSLMLTNFSPPFKFICYFPIFLTSNAFWGYLSPILIIGPLTEVKMFMGIWKHPTISSYSNRVWKTPQMLK